MMTQTHFLVGAALLCGPNRPARQNAAVLIGAFVPDFAIYALFIWSKIAGIPERELWNVIYFSEPMLTYTAIGNSAPLYAMITILGIAMVRSASAEFAGSHATDVPVGMGRFVDPAYTNVVILFGLGALAHVALDFPVHADDAHPHFWPVTDWRFFSPVSYWDNNHYGNWFAPIEALLGIVLAAILFRRFKALWVRALTAILMLAYIAVPAYFILILGGSS
ncbi:MAG: hypothetical protein AAFR13_03700 [Pseudomonadota bacterium]